MDGENRKAIGGNPRSTPGPSILGTVVAAVGATALVVAGFVFSLVFLAVALTLGVVVGGYVWWRTRDLRKQVRAQMEEFQRAQQSGQWSEMRTGRRDETVIEGEFVRESTEKWERRR
ncbi:MAG: hypothetical protein GC151_16375 [Betaproteobacteria bacterium]|nr:hypothetical protein [Betaproteobacteria bacterium]